VTHLLGGPTIEELSDSVLELFDSETLNAPFVAAVAVEDAREELQF